MASQNTFNKYSSSQMNILGSVNSSINDLDEFQHDLINNEVKEEMALFSLDFETKSQLDINDALQFGINILNDKNLALEKDISNEKRIINDIIGKLEEIHVNISALNAQEITLPEVLNIESGGKEADHIYDQIDEQSDNLRAEIITFGQQLASLSKERNSLQDKINVMDTANEKLQEEIERLTIKLNTDQNNFVIRQGILTKINKEKETRNNDLVTFDKIKISNRQLEVKFNQLTNDVKQAENHKEFLERANCNEDLLKKTLTEQFKRIEKKLTQIDEHWQKELENFQLKVEREISAWRDKISHELTLNEKLKSVEKLHQECSSLENELKDLNQQHTGHNSDIIILEKEIENLKITLANDQLKTRKFELSIKEFTAKLETQRNEKNKISHLRFSTLAKQKVLEEIIEQQQSKIFQLEKESASKQENRDQPIVSSRFADPGTQKNCRPSLDTISVVDFDEDSLTDFDDNSDN